MAGHSKWANTKHRKDRADKKKGKIFSRITKEIISAVKQAGPDRIGNNKLRIAIQKAKEANMPNENIDRNIKKAGSADTQDFFPMTYELYGHGGVGIIVDILTDNKNRTSTDMHIATKEHGGNVAKQGAVSHNFDRKGFFRIPASASSEDTLFQLIIDAGADDMAQEDEHFLVYTSIDNFIQVKDALEKAQIKPEEASLAMIPRLHVEASDEIADANIALIEYLEDLEDVDAVYHNMTVK